jgi:tyrosyl-tRNA synthetase
MTKYKSELLNYLTKRGYLYQIIDADYLDKILSKKTNFYIGFDCTAKSLHVGSLLQIMLIRILQRFGHKPHILLGGGTTRIGDPSDKDKSRPILQGSDIDANLKSLGNLLGRFFDFGKTQDSAILVNNNDWLQDINYIDFLRDTCSYFSVNQMLGYEFVKRRLEEGKNLSFLELNYMIIQAYDFKIMREKYDCMLQIGGSDQWGNILNGVELFRKVSPDAQQITGFTTPLLTTSDGRKMGKTADGAVWLDADLCSPYDFYQFWRNVADSDVKRFLNLFTDLDDKEIVRLAKLEGQEINEAKKILAFEATKISHGEEGAKSAAKTAADLFEKNKVGGDLPEILLNSEDLKDGVFLTILMVKAGLVDSRGDAKRLVKSGAAKIADATVTDVMYLVKNSDFGAQRKIKISAGKKKHAIIKISS